MNNMLLVYWVNSYTTNDKNENIRRIFGKELKNLVGNVV